MKSQLRQRATELFYTLKENALERVEWRNESKDVWEYFIETQTSFEFNGQHYILDLHDFIVSKRKKKPVIIRTTSSIIGKLDI